MHTDSQTRPQAVPPETSRTASLHGHMAMWGFSLFAAGSFVFGHMQAGVIAPSVMMALRFWIAAGALAAVAVVLGQGIGPALRRFYVFMPIGALMAVYFITMFKALALTSAVATSAVFTLTPLMTAGLGLALAGQRTSAWSLSALIIGGIGAVWVIFDADLDAILRFEIGRGEAIFFIGVVAHAFYPPLLKRWSRGDHPLQSAIGSCLGGAVVSTLWGLPEMRGMSFGDITPAIWALILYLALLATGVTFFLMQFAIQRISGAKVMAYTYAIPCWVVLYGLVFQGQTLPAPMWLGIGAAVLALLMLLRAD